nr:TPA_inf: RdRp [Giant mudskipper bafinivirus]
MVKDVGAHHETTVAKKFRDLGVPVLNHQILSYEGTDYLVRSFTTPYSIGDVVYAYYLGDFSHLALASGVPYESYDFDPGYYARYMATKARFRHLLEKFLPNLATIYNKIEQENLHYALTLDNVDLNGNLYDFGDYPSPDKPTNVHIISMIREFAAFCNYDLTQAPAPFGSSIVYDAEAFTHSTYLQKLLYLNHNIAFNSDTPSTAPTPFINAGCNTTQTAAIHSPLVGFHVVDWSLLQSNLTEMELQLVKTQDPSIYAKPEVISIGETIFFYGQRIKLAEASRTPFYNLDVIQELIDMGINLSATEPYHYQVADTEGITSDFMYYNYNSPKYFDPAFLEAIYTFMLKLFKPLIGTNDRLNYDTGTPRPSSMGVGVSGYTQKTIWGSLSPDFPDRLLDSASKTVLPFCTKIVGKYARTKKPRARTVGGSSFITSTLFRFLHKPITNKMVAQAQKYIGPFLIGVSKFNCGFSKYMKHHHPNGIEDCHVMGADYTKCDRSFPIICRALSAALFYDLGELDFDNKWFINEFLAYITDFSSSSGRIFNKPGGTTSGDNTTAYSNSFYNYFVHLTVQFRTFLSADLPPHYQVLQRVAHKAMSTCSVDDYMLYFDMVNDLNSTQYFFHFLSDDSFIVSKPSAFPVFTVENFSYKLQNILGCVVDVTKAWSHQGEIEEFCSSHIKLISGNYQYVPDAYNMLAGLCVSGEPVPEDKFIWKLVATCAELAIFMYVDPALFEKIYMYLQKKHAQFVEKHSLNLLPPQLLDKQFYQSLLDEKYTSDTEELFSLLVESGVNLQASSVCHFCDNPTVSNCAECLVDYAMCAYCSYIHYQITGHSPTQTPCCHVCQKTDVGSLNHTISGGAIRVSCVEHSMGLAIPLVDHVRGLIKIPLFNKCDKQPTTVSAILHTSLLDADGHPADSNFMKFDTSKTPLENFTKILHDTYMLDHHNSTTNKIYTYECCEGDVIRIAHAMTDCYGTNAYAEILDNKDRVVLKVTLDVLSAIDPTIYKVTTAKTGLFKKHSRIRRLTYKPRLVPLSAYNYLRNAEFIVGPPGTGKTTFVIKNFINLAGPGNKIAYIAPTHKLVQSMDFAIFEAQGELASCTVVKSELDTTRYHYPTNKGGVNIMLGTPGAVSAFAGCTMIMDEISLCQLNLVMQAITTVKPSKLIFLGDPFQLGPVTHLKNFSYTYTDFPYSNFCSKTRTLGVCYRCPTNILNLWVKPYTDAGIHVMAASEGGQAIVKVDDSTNIHDTHPQASALVTKYRSEFPDHVILCNYKKPIIGVENAMTIDSSQGKTYSHVILILFGSTKFTKVFNRAIVATSRATHSCIVVCCTSTFDHFSKIFGWQIPIRQHEYTPITNIQEVDYKYVTHQLNNLVVCDIEFFHLVHEQQPKKKCTLEVGDITFLTTTTANEILVPRKSSTDDSVYHKHQFGVPKATQHASWDYMKPHKGITQRINIDRTSRLFHHLANTTKDDIVFILYAGSNDLRALTKFNICGEFFCGCGKSASFYSIRKTVTHYCHSCASSAPVLSGVINAKYFDLQTVHLPRKSLTYIHDQFCNFAHGDMHTSKADTVITACLFGNSLSKDALPLISILSTEEFNLYQPYFPTPIGITKIDGDFRTFGQQNYTSINGKLYTFETSTALDFASHFFSHICKDSHSVDIVDCAECIPSCVRVRGKTCSRCLNTWYVIKELQCQMSQYGLAFTRQLCKQSYTQEEQRILSSVETITYDPSGIMKIVLKNGFSFPFQESFETSIKAYANRTNQPIPNPSIFKSLGVTATYGFGTPFVPYTTDSTKMNILSNVVISSNPNYYVIFYATVPKKLQNFAFSDIDAGFYIFDQPLVNIPNTTPAYFLVKFENGQPVSLDLGMTSTNRILTRQFVYRDGELSSATTLGHHVSYGDTTSSSFTIGGMHVATAFQAIDNWQLIPNTYGNPILRINVAKERGVKLETTAVDCNITKFEQLITTANIDISKVLTMKIDGVSFRVMTFTNPDGSIRTAYPQAQAITTTYKITPSYIIWPKFYVNQPVEKWDLVNYNSPPKNKTCDVNIHKYDQICDFLTSNLTIPVNGHVHHLGNAGNQYSPGDIVLKNYFTQSRVTSYDLRSVITSTEILHPDDHWKCHFLLSDIYVQDTDHTELLKYYITNHLRLGGSILFKMTETSQVSLPAITPYFGNWQLLTFAVNYSSSETYLFCSGYSGVYSEPIDPVQYNIMGLLGGFRKDLVFVPFCNDYTGTKFYKDTGRVKTIPSFLSKKLTPSHFTTGCIFVRDDST